MRHGFNVAWLLPDQKDSENLCIWIKNYFHDGKKNELCTSILTVVSYRNIRKMTSTGCLQVQRTLGAPLFSEVQSCLRSLSTIFDVGFLGDYTVETVYRVTGCRVKPDIG